MELVLSFHCGFQGSTSGHQALTHKWTVGEENIKGGSVHSARAGPTGYQGMGRQGLSNSQRGCHQEQKAKQAYEPVPVDRESPWQGSERQVTAGNKEWGRKVPDSVNCPACVDCVESREVAEAAELDQERRGTGSQGHGGQLGAFVSTGPF